MKTLFLVILSIVVFYCMNTRVINESVIYSDKDERENCISKLVEQEYLTGFKNDIVFFNLAFGMSEKEVLKQMDFLKKQNILQNISSYNGITKASYNLSYNDYYNSGRVYLFFNNDSLSELQIDTADFNKGKLKSLFIQKYGECNYTAQVEGNEESHWISGNRHIAFIENDSNNSILIHYIDTTDQIREKTNALLISIGLDNKVCS